MTSTTVVVPFRAGGKSRLPASIRDEVALAMLGDVLEAATALGPVRLVTAAAGCRSASQPSSGQTLSATPAAARALPCWPRSEVSTAPASWSTPISRARRPRRWRALPPGARRFVAAADGTTNALALPGPDWFAPLYGAGSAARFLAAGFAPVSIPELEQDVDTLADLERLALPAGPRTTLVVNHHKVGLARVP